VAVRRNQRAAILSLSRFANTILGVSLCFAGILQKTTDRLELLSLSKRKQIERLSSATPSRARADLKFALARVKHPARPNDETIGGKKRVEKEKRMEQHDGQPSPPSIPYIIALDVALVVLITLINLRGVRESGSILAFPTYFFVVTAMLLIAVIISFSKFLEGTWVVVLLIPVLVVMFLAIQKHYTRFECERTTNTPIRPEDIHHRLVVPIEVFDLVAKQSVAYARSISAHVTVVHVALDEQEAAQMEKRWNQWQQENLTQEEDTH
jgi:hypothetical protein